MSRAMLKTSPAAALADHRSVAAVADSSIKSKKRRTEAGLKTGWRRFRWRFQRSPSAVTKPSPKALRKRL